MQEVCIPLPRLNVQQAAEVAVSLEGRTRKLNYRVEAFDWGDTTSDMLAGESSRLQVGERIERLRHKIESYDRNWELIQIFNPKPRDNSILVMFRQRR